MRVFCLIFLSLFFVSSSYSSELNLFTSRHYPSDLILFKKFEEKTGIKVNVINAKSKVLEKRLLDEGSKSKGDVLFLADAGALYSAEEKKLLWTMCNYCVPKKCKGSLTNKKRCYLSNLIVMKDNFFSI